MTCETAMYQLLASNLERKDSTVFVYFIFEVLTVVIEF
jgi:hypothetical protein